MQQAMQYLFAEEAPACMQEPRTGLLHKRKNRRPDWPHLSGLQNGFPDAGILRTDNPVFSPQENPRLSPPGRRLSVADSAGLVLKKWMGFQRDGDRESVWQVHEARRDLQRHLSGWLPMSTHRPGDLAHTARRCS